VKSDLERAPGTNPGCSDQEARPIQKGEEGHLTGLVGKSRGREDSSQTNEKSEIAANRCGERKKKEKSGLRSRGQGGKIVLD